MYKYAIVLAALGYLVGCTATIKSDGFILQDPSAVAISADNIKSWATLFPEHQLNIISLPATDSDDRLEGLFFDHKNTTDIIYFIPGNGMSISKGGIAAMSDLSQLDQDMIIFDRRGLGSSSGKATVANLLTDADQQVDYIRQNLQPDNIIVHGYSLGSFVATQVAKANSIDGLVLQGAATNADEWVDERMSWFMKSVLTVKIEKEIQVLDNKQVLSEHYTGPLLVIGAEKDQQVPVSLSKSLYDSSASTHKQLIIVEDATHSTMLSDATTLKKYRTFVRSLVNR